MKSIYLVPIIILIYFFLVFIIPLLFFPYFLREAKIQQTKKIKTIANKLKSRNKEKTLENIFNYVKSKYYGKVVKLFLFLDRHFYFNVKKLLSLKNRTYLPCHVQNLILKILLINTGQFKEENFVKKIIITPILTIHQYYLIKINNKTFKADPYFKILREIK